MTARATTRSARQRSARRRETTRDAGAEVSAFYIATDLVVTSRRSLAPLAAALPDAYQPVGTNGRPMARLLVVNGISRGSVDADLRRLAARIGALRGAARGSWRAASRRVVDIGVQAGDAMPAFEGVQLSATTIQALAALQAEVRVTVYPPVRDDT
jgi:hypothetical protein